MKKTCLILGLAIFGLTGCGGSGSESSNDGAEDPKLKQEILHLDSTNQEMEEVATEIENAAEELEKSLNEL